MTINVKNPMWDSVNSWVESLLEDLPADAEEYQRVKDIKTRMVLRKQITETAFTYIKKLHEEEQWKKKENAQSVKDLG